jgi:hypothetical protein
MDERQVHLKTRHEYRRETITLDHTLPQGLHVVGWRERETLIAEGHYRCPHCRRADLNETSVVVQ